MSDILPKVAHTPSSADSDKNSITEKTGPVAHHPTVALATEYGINDKAIVRRIDFRIIPIMALLYLLSFLDRTNIGNASLFGLQTDLKLKGLEYANCLAIFFVFYVLFEVPSNMVMKAWRPSMWLPIIMLAWGVCITLMGIVQNYAGLFATRVFLGITEAGLFPGVTFFMTCWYRKREINLRVAIFFSMATMAGAFGGLLARLIQLMDGTAGLQGWRWIFILEGILTVVVAVAAFWLLYDYPDTASFLSPHERQYVAERLRLDTDGLSTATDKKFIAHAFKDWKIWVIAVQYFATLFPVYSFSLFSPTLVANLGYTAATAQLLSAPPYILAAITTVGAGWLSDRVGNRGLISIALMLVGIVGFTMCIATANSAVGYAGVFIGAAGIYPQIPLLISWGSNNMGGMQKRAIGMAIVVSVGNMGGILSSYVYRAVDKPRYFPGHGAIIGSLFIGLICATFLELYYMRRNKAKLAAIEARGHEWTAEEKKAHMDEGDDAPFFIYTL